MRASDDPRQATKGNSVTMKVSTQVALPVSIIYATVLMLFVVSSNATDQRHQCNDSTHALKAVL